MLDETDTKERSSFIGFSTRQEEWIAPDTRHHLVELQGVAWQQNVTRMKLSEMERLQ